MCLLHTATKNYALPHESSLHLFKLHNCWNMYRFWIPLSPGRNDEEKWTVQKLCRNISMVSLDLYDCLRRVFYESGNMEAGLHAARYPSCTLEFRDLCQFLFCDSTEQIREIKVHVPSYRQKRTWVLYMGWPGRVTCSTCHQLCQIYFETHHRVCLWLVISLKKLSVIPPSLIPDPSPASISLFYLFYRQHAGGGLPAARHAFTFHIEDGIFLRPSVQIQGKTAGGRFLQIRPGGRWGGRVRLCPLLGGRSQPADIAMAEQGGPVNQTPMRCLRHQIWRRKGRWKSCFGRVNLHSIVLPVEWFCRPGTFRFVSATVDARARCANELFLPLINLYGVSFAIFSHVQITVCSNLNEKLCI